MSWSGSYRTSRTKSTTSNDTRLVRGAWDASVAFIDGLPGTGRGRAMISPEVTVLLAPWRAVYVEVPKVACSSLKMAFAGLLGVDLDASEGDPHQANFPDAAVSTDPGGYLFPGFFAFAFVRNPWSRLVSCYRDKILGEVPGFTNFTLRPGVADCLARFEQFTASMSFEAFVEAVTGITDADADPHFRSQHTFVTNAEGGIALDFVGRFERLHDDFEQVARQIGLPAVALPHLQAVVRPATYAGFYTRATRDMVARRFAKDIELFGYCFEGMSKDG